MGENILHGQVFGLMGIPIVSGSFRPRLPGLPSSGGVRTSFPITAAGQPRNRTGFPLSTPIRNQTINPVS